MDPHISPAAFFREGLRTTNGATAAIITDGLVQMSDQSAVFFQVLFEILAGEMV